MSYSIIYMLNVINQYVSVVANIQCINEKYVSVILINVKY
jgi:hypothetical protein